MDQYIDREVGATWSHKFLKYTTTSDAYSELPQRSGAGEAGFCYLVEVYVDDFVSLVVPALQL